MSGKVVHVAVGVIVNSIDQVLISKRASHVHQANLWEFPGGKIEPEETEIAALSRELEEELGIKIQSHDHLMTVDHRYDDKSVCLHVFMVTDFSGEPVGKEGQLVKWNDISGLNSKEFPVANITIINRLQLPELIQITGGYSGLDDLLKKIKLCIQKGIKIIHFRAHELDDSEFLIQAKAMRKLCKMHNVKLILNRNSRVLKEIDVDGIHLTRHEMKKHSRRPIGNNKLFSVSCHNDEELTFANQLDVDYCFLSPVKSAVSHNAGTALGFDRFSELSKKYDFPIYALGGMAEKDILNIQKLNGKGVAVISANWE